MNNPCFDRFIPETSALIKLMLMKNPQHRISPDEALKHEYFVKLGIVEPQK